MYGLPVSQVMAHSRLLTAAPTTTVREAAKLMTRKKAGAVLVIDAERLVGIFTERDVVFRVVARGLDVQLTLLADVMTPSPHTISPEKPFGQALAVMHKNGFRHLPVIESGRLVGIVSSRSALDPDMEDFVAEARRRVQFMDQH